MTDHYLIPHASLPIPQTQSQTRTHTQTHTQFMPIFIHTHTQSARPPDLTPCPKKDDCKESSWNTSIYIETFRMEVTVYQNSSPNSLVNIEVMFLLVLAWSEDKVKNNLRLNFGTT